jgi:hypothetical protein
LSYCSFWCCCSVECGVVCNCCYVLQLLITLKTVLLIFILASAWPWLLGCLLCSGYCIRNVVFYLWLRSSPSCRRQILLRY